MLRPSVAPVHLTVWAGPERSISTGSHCPVPDGWAHYADPKRDSQPRRVGHQQCEQKQRLHDPDLSPPPGGSVGCTHRPREEDDAARHKGLARHANQVREQQVQPACGSMADIAVLTLMSASM